MSKVEGGKVFVEIGADPRKLFAALNKANKAIGQMGRSMSQFGGKMTAVGAAIGAPIALAMRQFAGFDDAIRATAAVSGASGAALQSLNDKARELGATTSFTAIQVANLMTELGRAGFKPDEIEDMTGAVLDLARATGTDATLASGIMAATLRQFGLGATDAARAADVLTAAANSTFNTVEGLGESLKYAGPVAKSLGMSLEDTTAILGVLGNVGIQGSEAGTALRRLSVISAGAGEELQKIFGISNTDADGNLKPLVDVLDEINTVTANMPVAERTAKMADAFGLLGITSANVLSASAEGVRGLSEQLRNAQGTAAKTAKEMDAGLGGAFRITLSAIEGTALALGDALAPSLQKIVEGIGTVAGGLTTFVKNNEALIVSVAKGIAVFTGVGAAIFGIGISLSAVSAALGVALNPLVAIPVLLAAAVAGFVAMDGGMGSLAETATTTFNGIYEAIAAGDLAGAMDILWAGLYAGWLRGSAALMAVVDPWLSMFQNAFTIMGAEIYKGWDWLWTNVSGAFNTIGAVIQGAMDNVINGVLSQWDNLEAGIRKSWNYVQSLFRRGFNLKTENEKVTNEMQARKRDRELRRPGIKGRTEEAARENDQADRDRADRAKAVDENTQATIDDRESANRQRDRDRRAEAQAADADVGTTIKGRRETRARNDQFTRLLKDIEGASSLDQLRDLYGEFDALSQNGRLTSGQQQALETALEDAQERISKSSSSMGGASDASKKAEAAAASGASSAGKSQAEVAGTFSSSLGGMGVGSSLAQKQLDVLKQIEQNTSEEGAVAA